MMNVNEKLKRPIRKSNYRNVPNSYEWCVDEHTRDTRPLSNEIPGMPEEFLSRFVPRPVAALPVSPRSGTKLRYSAAHKRSTQGFNVKVKPYTDTRTPGKVSSTYGIVIEDPREILRRGCVIITVDPGVASVTDFVPSTELAGYLVIAMNELRLTEERKLEQYSDQLEKNQPRFIAEIKNNLSSLERSYSIEDAKEHLRKTIKRLFGTIGRGLQSSGIDSYSLTSNGGEFEKNVRDAIFERVLVRQYDAAIFLNRLYRELRLIARSKTYGGNWGHLSLCSSELCLAISPKKETQKDNWKKARSL